MAKDLEGGNLVGGLEPFTGSDLAMFYSTFYQRSMAEELTAVSDEATAREGALQFREKEDLWLVQKAYDSLKEREGSDALPKRFASRSVYWIPYAGDDSRAFGRLLEHQKLYRDFVAAHETRFNVILHAQGGPDEREDAWAWTLPIPSELVAPLYKIDLLRGLGAMSENDLEAALAKGVPLETRNAKEINARALSTLIRDARDLGRTIRAGTPPSQGYYNWYARGECPRATGARGSPGRSARLARGHESPPGHGRCARQRSEICPTRLPARPTPCDHARPTRDSAA